jgi:hypothetical protein
VLPALLQLTRTHAARSLHPPYLLLHRLQHLARARQPGLSLAPLALDALPVAVMSGRRWGRGRTWQDSFSFCISQSAGNLEACVVHLRRTKLNFSKSCWHQVSPAWKPFSMTSVALFFRYAIATECTVAAESGRFLSDIACICICEIFRELHSVCGVCCWQTRMSDVAQTSRYYGVAVRKYKPTVPRTGCSTHASNAHLVLDDLTVIVCHNARAAPLAAWLRSGFRWAVVACCLFRLFELSLETDVA